MTDIFNEADLSAALNRIAEQDAPQAEKEARLLDVAALWEDAKTARRMAALDALRGASAAYLDHLERMVARMGALSDRAGVLTAPQLATARQTLARLRRDLGEA